MAGNGKVSLVSLDKKLAVICTQMGHVQQTIEEVKKSIDKTNSDLKEHGNWMRDLEKITSADRTKMENSCKEIKILRGKVDGIEAKSNIWGGVNTALALLAGILGINQK